MSSTDEGIRLPAAVRDRLRTEIIRQYGTQRDIAARLGISHHHLNGLLLDRNGVSWKLANRLAGALGLELVISVKRAHAQGALPMRPDRPAR